MTPISHLLPSRRERRATARAAANLSKRPFLEYFQPVLCPPPARPQNRNGQAYGRSELRNLRILTGRRKQWSIHSYLLTEKAKERARLRAAARLALLGMTVVEKPKPAPVKKAPPAPRTYNKTHENARRADQINRDEWRRHTRAYKKGLVAA